MTKTRAVAYSPFWRIVIAILIVVSRGSLLLIAALLLFLDAWLGTGFRLENPLRLFRAFASFSLVPGLMAWLLACAFEITADIQNDALLLHRRRPWIEIPIAAVDRVVPWIIPLPSDGVWLRLKSGRRFRYGLQIADPVAWSDALAGAGVPEHVSAVATHPAAVYASAKSRTRQRRWYHTVLKFPVFALVPTLPLFRLHQWIAYGGTFGEYYAFGPQAYLLAFAIWWMQSTIVLIVYAAVLRGIAEAIAWPAAWVAPSHAMRLRRGIEIGVEILYVGGVAAFLISLFLQSR